MSQRAFNTLSWSIFIATFTAVIIAWGTSVDFRLFEISTYQWFPLLGLVAWTTMAGHYYNGAVRVLNPHLKSAPGYKRITSYLVLTCLLLHPGLLAIKQFQNEQGLPPASFYDYVGDGLKVAVLLGAVALLIFLSFEFFDRMQTNKTIQKYWWMVSLSQSFAMTFIWIHALRLGSHLEGWFLAFWFVLGMALLPCFYMIHRADFTPKEPLV